MTAPDLEALAPRDPLIDPRPMDALKRWNTTHLVLRVEQGCVFTQPSLAAHREWVGIQYYREWAKDAAILATGGE